jgi:transcriptional regulator with XRE-family HTH domain
MLTVRERSQKSGVSEDAITKIENDHRKARPTTLWKLAKALNVEPYELIQEGQASLPERSELLYWGLQDPCQRQLDTHKGCRGNILQKFTRTFRRNGHLADAIALVVAYALRRYVTGAEVFHPFLRPTTKGW